MKMRAPRLVVPLALALLAAACIDPTNPFDPDTPAEGQQPGTLNGTVFALLAPTTDNDDRLIEAPGLCNVSAVDGDHSGFVIALRPLVDDPLLGVGVETAQTNASGRFSLKNIKPGRYSFEVLADDFLVPAPAEITVGIGETLSRTLCALDARPPSAPVLAPLPAVVASTVDVTLTILAPESGATYTVTESTTDGSAPVETTVTATADDAFLDVPLALGFGASGRVPFAIDVVATDALGNSSDPTRVTVVRDGAAPAAPADITASAARDRVFVSFSPGVVAEGDDGAASYAISYAVSARPFDALDACPHGQPFDAIADDAFFAVEGPSPLLTAATQQTLSGLTPGTELFLYVAAFDAAGNASCFSAPVRVRPDEVTFVRVADRGPSLENARAVVALPGSNAGALLGGYVVASADSTLVVDALGAEHTLDGARTVGTRGSSLLLAGGLLGVGSVALDGSGAPGAVTYDDVGDTNDVAGEPGLAFGATESGLFVDGAQVASGAHQIVRLLGAVALVVRSAAGGFELAVLDRSAAFAEIDAVAFVGAPLGAAVVGRSVVVVDSAGVRAFDVAACLPAGAAAGCLGETPRRTLPAGEVPSSVAALDDIALVGTPGGSVFALSLPSLSVVGRIGFDAPVDALVPDDLGFCASLDAVGAVAPRLSCATVAAFPLQDGEERVPSVEAALGIALAGARAIAVVGDAVLDVPLDDVGAAVLVPVGGDVIDVASVAREGLALRSDGTVVAVRAGRASSVIVDVDAALSTLAADVDTQPYTGFVAAVGDALLAVLVDTDGDAALVRATLLADADGTFSAVVDDALVLPALSAATELLVHGGRAYVGTRPLGLLSIDLGATLALDADSALPLVDDQSFAASVVLGGAPGAFSVLAPTRSADGVEGFAALSGGALVGIASQAPAGISSAVRAGRFIAVTTFASGAFLLSGQDAEPALVVPLLAFPSVATATEIAVSARGLVFADAAGGVSRTFVR